MPRRWLETHHCENGNLSGVDPSFLLRLFTFFFNLETCLPLENLVEISRVCYEIWLFLSPATPFGNERKKSLNKNRNKNKLFYLYLWRYHVTRLESYFVRGSIYVLASRYSYSFIFFLLLNVCGVLDLITSIETYLSQVLAEKDDSFSSLFWRAIWVVKFPVESSLQLFLSIKILKRTSKRKPINLCIYRWSRNRRRSLARRYRCRWKILDGPIWSFSTSFRV